mgnify:CR=1 FL=1
MNKWQKIGLAVGMGAAVVTTTHLINSIIFKSSTANNYTGKRIRSNYQWKFGNIAYVTPAQVLHFYLYTILILTVQATNGNRLLTALLRIIRYMLLIY